MVSNLYQNIGVVGAKGFIGSQLAKRSNANWLYGRENIETIRDSKHDLLICAGAPAEKWKANLNPELDKTNLDLLARELSQSNAKKIVLISTIDVLGPNSSKSEEAEIDNYELDAYGLNRRNFEQQVLSISPDSLVLRLPGMFGPGLKKNIIFDLINDRELLGINLESSFQWYDVRDLWGHMLTALQADLQTLHLATEPVSVLNLIEALGIERKSELETTSDNPHRYEMLTNYAEVISGRESKFLRSSQDCLSGIKQFAKSNRASIL
jgi:nucleoside-diphosphate-sugar epimerase